MLSFRSSLPYGTPALALAGLVLCHAGHAQPSLDEATPTLPEVTVKAPAQIPQPGEQAVDLERLQRHKAKSLQEIFKADPSVQAGTGARNGEKLFLRGIEDLNMNVQIDGARQGANLFHHQGRLAVDPQLLKAVKIQTGPSPADAGPGALGGSVKFETVDAQDMLRPGQTFGARLGTQYESAADTLGGSASLYGLAGGRIGLLGYVRRLNNDTIRAGGGEKLPSTNGQTGSYLLKASILDQDGHSLWASAERQSNEGGYLRANFAWQTNNATQALDAQEFIRDTFTLRHRYQSPSQPLLDVQTTVYRNDSEIRLGGANAANAQVRNENWLTESTGGDIRNTARFATGAARHELTAGLDYFHDESILRDHSLALRLGETARNTGAYVQDRVAFGRWLVSGGLRVDRYRTRYANGYETSGTKTSPNLSGEWLAWDNGSHDLSLFAGYGESVRGGKLNQAGWLKKYFLGPDFTRPRGFTLGENGQLEAERAIQRQWGLRWQGRGLLQPQDQAGVELSFYNTRLRNYQVVPGEGANGVTDRILNAPGSITSRGYEIRAHWGLPDWMFSTAFSRGTVRNYNGQPMDTSGDSARVGVSTGDRLVFDAVWQASSQWQLGYSLTAVRRLKDVPASRPEKPGYATHGLQAVWKPQRWQQNLTLTLGVDNLLDKHYAQHTAVRIRQATTTAHAVAGQEYTSPEPGRNLRIALDWRF